MDVFVVLEEGSVLGVGASWVDAEALAGRTGDETWSDWRGPDESGTWRRTRSAPIGPFDGAYQATQRIVTSPLAGTVRVDMNGLVDPFTTPRG